MLRDLVTPAIPAWDGKPEIEQVRRLALHAVRGKLTNREVAPAIMSRGDWDDFRQQRTAELAEIEQARFHASHQRADLKIAFEIAMAVKREAKRPTF
jgi:hypothetical protein